MRKIIRTKQALYKEYNQAVLQLLYKVQKQWADT